MTKNSERKGHCELLVLADLLRNDLMACAMCIVSNYEADFNLLGEWKCRGEEFPVCPECQSPMKYRDTRQRHIRREGGVKLWGQIRRLFCRKCHRLHNELPKSGKRSQSGAYTCRIVAVASCRSISHQ